MENTNNTDVVRRGSPGSYKRQQMPVVASLPLPRPTPSAASFASALSNRHSAIHFGPLTHTQLSNFLCDVAGLRCVDRDDLNRQKRAVGSMGALHPAHILMFVPDLEWCVYIPEEHALGRLIVNEEASGSLLGLVEEHFPGHNSVVLCLLSDCDLAANYYDNCAPVLLRDAGVLLGHAALVASAHDLAFRILGRTGTRITENLVKGLAFRPMATGLALLGSNALESGHAACQGGA